MEIQNVLKRAGSHVMQTTLQIGKTKKGVGKRTRGVQIGQSDRPVHGVDKILVMQDTKYLAFISAPQNPQGSAVGGLQV